MRFEVEKLEKAQEEFDALTQEQQLACSKDYETIEKQGLEFVKRRFLRDGLFEIKTNEVRSLFQYRENKVILIGNTHLSAWKQMLDLKKIRTPFLHFLFVELDLHQVM